MFNLRRDRTGAETIFEEMMTKNFVELMNYTNPKIQKPIKSEAE